MEWSRIRGSLYCMRLMTKNSILVVSCLGTFFVGLLFILGQESCYANDTCRQWRIALSHDNFSVLILFVPMFLLSLVTYRMDAGVFNAWKNLLIWTIPAAIGVILLVPDNGSFMWSDPKLSLSILFSVAFLFGSIAIIFWRSRNSS